MPDSQLVYVSGTPPQPLAGNVSSFSQGNDCGAPIPGAPPNSLDYAVSHLSWAENRISFDVDVNQSAFVLVSSSYSPGWLAEDNGSYQPMSFTPPGLPVINVTSGLHHIVLYYPITTNKETAAILSLVALAGLLIAIPVWNKREVRRL